ncbi:MAG: hypothetical protein LBD77_05065, partial [Bifidobacteriaceae bacterium]|nr:hypothetical protein [Bifidobacteriaceae bacterium]
MLEKVDREVQTRRFRSRVIGGLFYGLCVAVSGRAHDSHRPMGRPTRTAAAAAETTSSVTPAAGRGRAAPSGTGSGVVQLTTQRGFGPRVGHLSTRARPRPNDPKPTRRPDLAKHENPARRRRA